MGRYEEVCEAIKKYPKLWVVTGATGFIGSNLVHRLLDLNQKVIGIDNLSTSDKKNITELKKIKSKKFNFYKCDIQDYTKIKKLMKRADFVLHQAAIGSVPRSIKDPLYSHYSNVNGFLTVLKASVDLKIKKFVYASSSSVYGDHPALPKTEANTGNLLSPYAATKSVDEIYAGVFARVYNTPVVGLRYFNVFGPRQSPKGPYAAVIPLWIDAMLKEKPVYINGDGSFSRDFCFVENVVRANILAATSDNNANNKVFNIANGDRTNLNELFNYIRSAVRDMDAEINVKDAVYREERKGDIPHSHADITLAKKILGYEPAIRVGEGLGLTVQYIYEN